MRKFSWRIKVKMRKQFPYIHIFSLAILLITLFASCNSASQKVSDRGIGIDSICKDTTIYMKTGQQNPNLHIFLNLKYTVGPSSRAINDTILRQVLSPDYLSLTTDSISPIQMVDSFLVNYSRDYRTFYGHVWAEEPNSTNANVSLDIQTDISDGRDDVMLYVARMKRKQGAQQVDYTKAYSINMNDGRWLHLNDVFVPGYERDLNEQIIRQLCQTYDIDDQEKISEAGLFVHTDVYATQNFLLCSDAISFIYVNGEIADSSFGEITVTIPYSDIKNILR